MPNPTRGIKYLILLLLLKSSVLSATTYPAEGASFFARRIPFVAEKMKGADRYRFKIYEGRIEEGRKIKESPFFEEERTTNELIAELPLFNVEYSWWVEYLDKSGEKIGKSKIVHFRVLGPDEQHYRIRVLENKYPDSTLCFFLDGCDALYNLKGEVVWYMADKRDPAKQLSKIDIRLSPFNTVTYIAGGQGYEVDYNGNVLWSTPPGDTANRKVLNYHHELRRLSSGNYMTLINEVQDRWRPKDMVDGKDSLYKDVVFDAIVEYNDEGKTVWEWHSAPFFSNEEIFSKRTKHGDFNPRTNLNAFCFDEKSEILYASFRHISKIFKISYPDKAVLSRYTGKRKNGFLKQHSVNINLDGDFYFFSNGNGSPANISIAESAIDDDLQDTVARIIVLSEVAGDTNNYTKKWEFPCMIDSEASPTSTRAGSVQQLADGSYFVCMGATPRIFIVNKNKEILYNAIVEQWNNGDQMWLPFLQYRASPLTINEFDKLINGSIPAGRR